MRFGGISKILLAFIVAAIPFSAAAQSGAIIQSGSVTAGHAGVFAAPNVMQDAGTSVNGGFSSLGVTNSGSCGVGINSAATTGQYYQTCLGSGTLTFTPLGGASATPFDFVINGTTYQFGGSNWLSGWFDSQFCSTQGSILYRSSSDWVCLAPGLSGQVLQTKGGGQNPAWATAAGTGTVTSITAGTGLTGGTITTSGTIGTAGVLNDLALINQAQGDIYYYNGTNLVALPPGTAGNVLTTQGASANPEWAAGALPSLSSADIWVGNGSNVATAVALSGDATLANTGAMTLNTVNSNVGSFTNASITVNAKGLITAASSGSATTPNYSLASGFVNVLRNASLSAWFHGTSGTITTAGGWAAEGIYVVPTGASVPFSQLAVGLAGPGYYALQITGAASVSDLIVRFIVDGATATKLFAQNSNTQAVTFQMTVYTSVGGSLTPKITVKHAGSFNNWGSPTTDVNAQSMQAVANNTVTTVSYTWTITSGTQNGLSIDIDFGNNFGSNSDTINIYGGFDLRATPGVATGINNSPPTPEIRDAASDIAWCQRFYYSTYENGTAPGTSTVNGAPLIYGDAATTLLGLQFPTPMISAPSCSMWDLAGTSNKVSAYNGATLTNGFATASINSADTKRVVVTQAGAAGRVYGFHVTCDATINGA